MGDKVTLSFKVAGKVFTYEGNPATREKQFFDLIIQRDVQEVDVPAAYRDNFDVALEEDVILQRYRTRVQEKSKRSSRKTGMSQDPLPNVDAPASPAVYTQPPAPAPEPQPAYVPPQQYEQPTPPAQDPPVTTRHVPPPAMSADEVADLNRFINHVLQETPGTAKPPSSPVAPPPRDDSSVLDMSQNNINTTGGDGVGTAPNKGQKHHIFLHVDGAESQKMLNISKTTTFAELQEAVQRKLNMVATLSFVDADGMRIDVDDDDALEMFLQLEAKKLVLKCSGTKPIPIVAPTPVPKTQVLATHEVTSVAPSEGTLAGGVVQPVAPPAPAAQENPLIRTLLGHTAAVYGCAFSPDGTQIVSASRDHTVRIWSVEKGVSLQTIKAHNAFVLCCDYSPKGTHVVSCSDDLTIKLWNASSGKKMYMLKEHTDKVYCTTFMGGGEQMASCSCDCTVKVWNVENGSRLASLKPHEKAVFRLGASHTDGGKLLVTSCDDHTSHVLDWKDSRIVRKLVGHSSTVWSAQFSHDDRYVITSSMDHSIKMWEVATGREVCTFTGHATPVHAAMFCKRSRDTAAISCARDWTIGLWDVASTKLTSTFPGHTNTVYNIAQREDLLVSCSLDESLKLWRLPKRIIDPANSL
jgi:WD40 repeat protein